MYTKIKVSDCLMKSDLKHLHIYDWLKDLGEYGSPRLATPAATPYTIRCAPMYQDLDHLRQFSENNSSKTHLCEKSRSTLRNWSGGGWSLD